MSSSSDRPTPRREFLGTLATSAVALTGVACASTSSTPAAAAAPAPAARPQGAPPAANTSGWDDSWFAKLTAPHKAVFDSPAIEGGMGITHVEGYLKAMKDVLNADAQAVLVIRHSAIAMVFTDAAWAKYEIGKVAQIRDGNADATKNPYAAQFARLASRGVILLGCDLATRNFAGRVASNANADRTVIYEALKQHLLPGFILQPTGVYGVHRAQEAGCTAIRST